MPKTRNISEETGLTSAQERALLSLLSTPTHEMAAKQAGITSRTLRKYLRTPAFHAEYLARRREMMSSAIALAQQFAADMAAVQITLAKDAGTPPSVRVAAASAVLNLGQTGLQTEDLEARINRLEEVLNDINTDVTGSSNGTHSRRIRR
jgi:hypothetical protein